MPNKDYEHYNKLSKEDLISMIEKRDTEIKNVQNLNMSLEVNGKKMQVGNTSKMIFNINFLLSYLSNFMTLKPGDIITTGTPPGVGMAKKPPKYLIPGDKVKLYIENLGEQFHKVINEN